jgi:ComF family protein
MRELLRGLLDLALPPVCARCGSGVERTALLCRRCLGALPRIDADRCVRCQQAPRAEPLQRCHGCGARATALRACLAGVWFEGEVEGWIRRFKYPPRGLGRFDADATTLARALVREAAARAPVGPPDRVVPIPLHARTLRRRGFNPAALLAREVAHATRAPLACTALQRVRDTPSQTGLDRAARRRNVRGAFRARGPQPAHVWLVDDVVTTGATLEEAARTLRRAGARRITALCAARTPAP